MKPPHQHTRINLDELKAQIMKKLGPQGSKQYFYYLHRFLSLKLSKVEFNKLCLRILGRENIPLHNQLIRSILKNACSAKVPPPSNHQCKDDIPKKVGGKGIPSDSHHQNGSHIPPVLPNGGHMLLPVSPRKARTGLRDRRGGDRRSALGPNGNTGFTQASDFNVILENGYLHPQPANSMDIVRPLQHHQVALFQQLSEIENVGRTHSEIDYLAPQEDNSARSPIRAPFGVPFCPASIGGARRAGGTLVGPFCDGALLDSLALRERMESIAFAEGLEGVSGDCANVLNHGLDSYMKGLIKSCIDIVGSRSGCELIKNNAEKKDLAFVKLINGVNRGHEYHLENKGAHSDVVHEREIDGRISLQDFRVAMEVNPRQLGEDWPVLLEKICTHSFEE